MNSGGTEQLQYSYTTLQCRYERCFTSRDPGWRRPEDEKLVTVLNSVYVYMIALSGNPVNRQKCLLGQIPNRPLVALKFCWISAAVSALLYIDACAMFPVLYTDEYTPNLNASAVVGGPAVPVQELDPTNCPLI